jgi:catechol 2,3-dioxygenase-like lactoylglutathione lyase family enzyme
MNFKINKIHHVELTVRNLEISKKFYESLPGFKSVAEYPDFVMFSVGDFYLGLTTHNKPKDIFEETITGLDHVSFEVGSRQDLDSAISFFDTNNIKHGEIKKLSNDLWVLAFRDPDNIQLELCYKQS